MSQDPYKDKLLDQRMPCYKKTLIVGRVNCVLHARAENRALELIPFPSRAVLKNEIHELILTTEMGASPTKTVNKIAYLAFFEILEGGILWAGDRVDVNGSSIGYLAGYDLTHFPNHMNLVIKVDDPLRTGLEMGVDIGAPVVFTFENRIL
jgi:hypothetical protein